MESKIPHINKLTNGDTQNFLGEICYWPQKKFKINITQFKSSTVIYDSSLTCCLLDQDVYITNILVT